MNAELRHVALEGTRDDREQALVSFAGEASEEDLAASATRPRGLV